MEYFSPQRNQYYYYSNNSSFPKAECRVCRDFDQQASESQAGHVARPNRQQQVFRRPVRPYERELQTYSSPWAFDLTDYTARGRVSHQEPAAVMDYNAAYSKFLAVNANWKTQHSAGEQAAASTQPVGEEELDEETRQGGPVQVAFDQNQTSAAAALSATNMYNERAVASSGAVSVTEVAQETTINPQLLTVDTEVPEGAQEMPAPAVSEVSMVECAGTPIDQPRPIVDDEESMFVDQWPDDDTECEDSPRSEATVIASAQSQPVNHALRPVNHVYPEPHVENQENRIDATSHMSYMGGFLPQHGTFYSPRPGQARHGLLQNRGVPSNERFPEGSVQRGNFNAPVTGPAATTNTPGYSRPVTEDLAQADNFLYGYTRTDTLGFNRNQHTRVSRNEGVFSHANNYDAEDDMYEGQQHFYRQSQQTHAADFVHGRPQIPPPRPVSRLAHRIATTQYQESPTMPPPRPTMPVLVQTFKEGNFTHAQEEQARAHSEQQVRQQTHARIQMREQAEAQMYFANQMQEAHAREPHPLQQGNQHMLPQTLYHPPHVQQAHMQTPYLATQDSQMPVRVHRPRPRPLLAQRTRLAQEETLRQLPQAAHSHQLHLGDEQRRELIQNHSQLQEYLFSQLHEAQVKYAREQEQARQEQQRAIKQARDQEEEWIQRMRLSLSSRQATSGHEPTLSNHVPQYTQSPNAGPNHPSQTTQFAHASFPRNVQTHPPPRDTRAPVPTIQIIESTPEKNQPQQARTVSQQAPQQDSYLTVEPRPQTTEPRVRATEPRSRATEPRIASQEPWANDHVFYNSPTMTIGHPSRAPEHQDTANHQHQPVPAPMDHLQHPGVQPQMPVLTEPWHGHLESAEYGTQGGWDAPPSVYAQSVAFGNARYGTIDDHLAPASNADMAPDMIYTQPGYAQTDDVSPYYYEQR